MSLRSSSIHQHANFPPNLEIKSSPLEEEYRSASEGKKVQDSFLEDVRSFGIAAKTWDASFRLLDYLVGRTCITSSRHFNLENHHYPYPSYQPLSPLLINATTTTTSATLRQTIVLDLGSGACHLPIGLARAVSESEAYSNQSIQITATDLRDVLPLLQRNISRQNFAENVKLSARALTWGNPEEIIQLIDSFDLDTYLQDVVDEEETQFIITCSDLIFFRWLFGPLIRTLLFLTSSATFYPPTLHKLRNCIHKLPPATVFIGYKQRNEFLEFPFFLLLGRYFKLEPIISQRPNSISKLNETATNQTPQDLKLDHNEEEEDIIHLLKATRHPSTLDLDLSLVFDDDNPTGSNTSSLSKYGLAEGADQWELMMLSNLFSHI